MLAMPLIPGVARSFGIPCTNIFHLCLLLSNWCTAMLLISCSTKKVLGIPLSRIQWAHVKVAVLVLFFIVLRSILSYSSYVPNFLICLFWPTATTFMSWVLLKGQSKHINDGPIFMVASFKANFVMIKASLSLPLPQNPNFVP